MTSQLIILLAVGGVVLLLILVYLYRTISFTKRCPVCGNPHPDRVARPKLLKIVRSKAYHCTACGKRFYQIGAGEDVTSIPV